MTKHDAMKLFQVGSIAELARIIGLTRQAVSAWPEELPIELQDRITGVFLRHRGLQITPRTPSPLGAPSAGRPDADSPATY